MDLRNTPKTRLSMTKWGESPFGQDLKIYIGRKMGIYKTKAQDRMLAAIPISHHAPRCIPL